MKRLFLLVAVLIAIGLGIPAYHTFSDAQKNAAFSKVEDSKPPLTIAEVEKIMGNPTHIEHSETTGITGDVYHYPYHDRDMKIVFVNGIVFNAQFVSGAKS